MPRLPSRIVGLFVVALAFIGLVAGSVWQVRHKQASQVVMQALEHEERTNDPAPLVYALDHGGDPNATEQDSDLQPGTVRGWIKCLFVPDRGGPSVLEVAVCDHQLAAVQLILAHGANVRRRGLNGQTPIMNLAQHGMDCVESWMSDASGPVPREMQDQDRADDKILSLLLAHGANINATTADGKTALMFAASQHSAACVRLLLDNGAKADKVADNGETALSDALGIVPDNPIFGSWGGRADPNAAAITKLLLQHGADPNQKLSNSVTILGWAGEFSQTPIVLQLLQSGANTNVKDSSGNTVLDDAIRHGDAKVVRAALDHGADPNDLMATFDPDRPDILKLLLEHGAAPNNGQNGWRTPLTAAAYQHDLPMIRLLLAHGAHVNQVTTDDRTTALIEDAHQRVRTSPKDRASQMAIASLLLAHGANPNAANKDGKTAMDFAKASGKTALVTLLRAHGAKE